MLNDLPFGIRHLAFFLNPAVRRDASFRGLFADEEYRDVHAYFAAHPELPPTPLRPLDGIARSLGIAALDAKDETQRFGVEAFKIAGVRYALHRLGDAVATRGVVCATAGNHGRAVARVAKQKQIPCTVFVPAVFVPARKSPEPVEAATRAARIAAMRDDDADVVDVHGTYDEAVVRAGQFAATENATIISDTSWVGYEDVPRWIMTGYTQLFEEAFSQWTAPPTLVVIQGGVGGLVCAAASWFAWRFGVERPFLVAAEPERAACLFASARAGRAVSITDSLDTVMAGLRCATPSSLAWPAIQHGIDAFVTVADEPVIATMAALGADQTAALAVGPSGACGLAALVELARSDTFANLRSAAPLDAATRGFVVLTEGR